MFRYIKRIEDKVLNKLTWQDNIVNVFGYKEIKSIKDDEITLKDFVVVGEKLKIVEFDGYLIKISGEIKKILKLE